MGIINLTQKNFTKVLSEKIDNMGVEGIFASALLGGKEEMKKAIADIPDENLLWVDTNHVIAASGLIKIIGFDETAFRIYFDHPDRKDKPIWIKGDDYKRFILEWNGDVKSLTVGEYEIPSGYHAVVYEEEGKFKVKVEEIEEQ